MAGNCTCRDTISLGCAKHHRVAPDGEGQILATWFRGLGFRGRVWGLGLGFRVQSYGFGFRVWGWGFGVPSSTVGRGCAAQVRGTGASGSRILGFRLHGLAAEL